MCKTSKSPYNPPPSGLIFRAFLVLTWRSLLIPAASHRSEGLQVTVSCPAGSSQLCFWLSVLLTSPKPLLQVQCLEQQNKVLTTRWNFLKDQDNSHSESDIKAIYDQYMSKMNQEMKALNYEQENLELELTKVLSTMDNFRSK